MFPMTITLQNTAQLNAVLAALSLGTAAAAEPTTAQLVEIAKDRAENAKAAKETATAGKSAAAAPAHSKPTAKAEAVAAPEKSTEQPAPQTGTAAGADANSAAEITYEQVGKAITERAKTDRAAVIAALAQFDAKKGPDLKPEQYADFLKALG